MTQNTVNTSNAPIRFELPKLSASTKEDPQQRAILERFKSESRGVGLSREKVNQIVNTYMFGDLRNMTPDERMDAISARADIIQKNGEAMQKFLEDWAKNIRKNAKLDQVAAKRAHKQSLIEKNNGNHAEYARLQKKTALLLRSAHLKMEKAKFITEQRDTVEAMTIVNNPARPKEPTNRAPANTPANTPANKPSKKYYAVNLINEPMKGAFNIG